MTLEQYSIVFCAIVTGMNVALKVWQVKGVDKLKADIILVEARIEDCERDRAKMRGEIDTNRTNLEDERYRNRTEEFKLMSENISLRRKLSLIDDRKSGG